ncbi:hypothetical protein [Mycobacterium sp.]|uniref:hypothetical protein n=1 Tax=Mycobacterium sp. TaxID=1785 RepID=UPI002D35C0B5|nr:hypothetical protein [Mycobacterium sp.]HZA12031.1 hypothetical protein [Mycobacterium sp.]
MTSGRETDEPIDDQVPVADAVEQRRPVGETQELSEDFQPTEVSELAAGAEAPDEANPADWQEQLTSAETDMDWDADVD